MNDKEVWEHVRTVTGWLDANSSPLDGDHRILRCMKIAEELGEVTAAIIGVTGQNPRKGTTHTWLDVREELCDVILAAMVALESVDDNAEEIFVHHVRKRNARILGLDEPTCACCGEKAYVQGDGKWWCGNCVSRCEPQEESG